MKIAWPWSVGGQAAGGAFVPGSGEKTLSLILMVVAAAHVPVVRPHAEEQFLLGAIFAFFTVTVALAAVAVLRTGTETLLILVAHYMLLALCVYVVTRALAIPWFEDDRGEWLSPAPWVQLSVLSELAALATAGVLWKARRDRA